MRQLQALIESTLMHLNKFAIFVYTHQVYYGIHLFIYPFVCLKTYFLEDNLTAINLNRGTWIYHFLCGCLEVKHCRPKRLNQLSGQ